MEKTTPKALETSKLSCYFGNLAAVREVDLSIAPNCVHSILGPNGAGKTTLIKLLSGEISPTSGDISFFGTSITHASVQRRVKSGLARCFQITSIFQELSVMENVRLGCQSKLGWRSLTPSRIKSDAEDSELALAILEKVGLAKEKNRLAGELSYGQQRLLDVGLALSLEPRLLLLDEPAAGVGLDELPRMTKLLKDLATEYTIVLIEHNVDLIMEISDFITVMQRGEVLISSTPETVVKDERVREAYLGGG